MIARLSPPPPAARIDRTPLARDLNARSSLPPAVHRRGEGEFRHALPPTTVTTRINGDKHQARDFARTMDATRPRRRRRGGARRRRTSFAAPTNGYDRERRTRSRQKKAQFAVREVTSATASAMRMRSSEPPLHRLRQLARGDRRPDEPAGLTSTEGQRAVRPDTSAQFCTMSTLTGSPIADASANLWTPFGSSAWGPRICTIGPMIAGPLSCTLTGALRWHARPLCPSART